MAYLVKCSLCGRSVSNECRSCPGCGHNVANEIFKQEYSKKQEEFKKLRLVENDMDCSSCSHRTDEDFKQKYYPLEARCRYWSKSTSPYGARCGNYIKSQWQIEQEQRIKDDYTPEDPDPYNVIEW